MKRSPRQELKVDENVPSLPDGQDPEPRKGKLVLRLYITRGATNSLRALANLRVICEMHFPEQVDLDVVDILADPRRAFRDGILLTPTLVKLFPQPEARIIGDLSQTDKVLHLLGAPAGD